MKRGPKEESIVSKSLKWYEEYSKADKPCKHSKTDVEVLNLKDEAKRYLDAETSVFQLKQSKSTNSETTWLTTALKQGTTSDKVAAAIVLVQDNPKYNLSRLTMLVNQVRVAKHNQCSMIITSLKELFLLELLHPEHKLLKFEEQDLDQLDKSDNFDSGNTIVKSPLSRKKLMGLWYFEDQLHEHYERFVTALAAIASDTVDTNRELAISVMTELLIGNAEQEHKLLELIVNKIGDPSSKVGSKVIFCLNKLLHEHPNMKLIVLKEIEKLLFRKNVAQRAQYYAICLLTQFLLNRDDEKLASTLIEVYFAFFKACLKKGEPDSRMMAAILTGVNRAYPFAKMDSNVLQDHIESVYKVVHIGSFNVSINALNLLYQIAGKDEHQSTRFYSAFYRKLLDPQIGVANKRAVFLNLLFRVLQNDHSIQRLYAFIRRTLQVSIYFPANMACAILYVISKVLNTHKGLKNFLLNPEDCKNVKNDVVDIDNSFESENNDISVDKSNVADSILLTNVVTENNLKEDIKPENTPKDDTKSDMNQEKEYNPLCRNPLYAGISKGLTTELVTLSKHYHPSVALFANTILEGKLIEYTGDPLEDLSLMRFLDRYVFKNPKKLEDKKVQKKNDPLAQRAGYAPKGIRCIPVDSASYINEKEERIPVDELYLYRYLKKRKEFKHDIKIEDDDVESVNSEEFDDMLDRLTDGKDFEDLDIANDIKTGRSTKDVEEEEEDLDDDSADSDENVENEDLDEEDDDNLESLSDMDLDEDDDISDLEFGNDIDDGDDDDGSLHEGIQSKINTQINKRNRKRDKENGNVEGIDGNIFVSAEKFAEMLEQHSKQKGKHGGTDALNTTDGASSKQLEWEMKRHYKVKGSMNKSKRKNHKPFKRSVKRIKR